MAKTAIMLKAEAKRLGIQGYRQMTVTELESAIAGSTTTAAPAKGKAPGNGAKGKGKARAAVSRVVKGKGKAAPAKGKGKATPAKGKATTPKRSTVKRGAAKPAAPAKTRGRRKPVEGRVNIERSAIDWKAESGVGRTGKRAEVMAQLRKTRGDYDKTHKALEGKAKSWYPQHDANGAQRMLRWLINRVAFDFVMATGQHEMGQRAAYGTSTAAQDIRRRELRANGKPKSAKRSTRKRTPAKRGATAKRTTAKRSTAKRSTAKRATTLKGKGKGK